MKFILTLGAIMALAIAADCAPDTAWHQVISKMSDQMRAVHYESYEYIATTKLAPDSTHNQSGHLYLNIPDTMLYHVIGPVSTVLTREQFLRRDEDQRQIAIADWRQRKDNQRASMLAAFFNPAEALKLLEGTLKNARLEKLTSAGDSIALALLITDSVSFEGRIELVLGADDYKLREIRYDITRHTDFRNPTPDTDFRQLIRCYNYRWTRDVAAERKMQEASVQIEKQLTSSTYKVTHL